ncbi:MAG: hypothetical protein WDM92_15495 [Caulobacteraceae bacterium]
MSQPGQESPDAAKARRWRNWALAGVLLLFVVLVFVTTIVRLGGHVLD